MKKITKYGKIAVTFIKIPNAFDQIKMFKKIRI